jgi:CBS domain-containing protein
MSVGEFCNREVVIAHRHTSIVEAAKLMRQYHVGDLVVVESAGGLTKPVGILTDRDIVLALIAGEVPLETVSVGEVMSAELVTAQEGEGIWEALQHMRARGVRRMVVVNEEGGLEGILTVDDLLELFSEEIFALASVPRRGQEQEKKLRG